MKKQSIIIQSLFNFLGGRTKSEHSPTKLSQGNAGNQNSAVLIIKKRLNSIGSHLVTVMCEKGGCIQKKNHASESTRS